jgi:magnesium chelatase subunit H
MNRHLLADSELSGVIHALDAGYIPAVAGGDVLHSRETLPTGRNIHGFDPFRLPTAKAQRAGTRHAELLLERHVADTGALPRSIAFVLWGSDNLKNEGVPIAQVMALMGVRPRFDAYGKLCGSELIPLAELGRPRIDVLTTLSGVFRDLLPLQTRMLAEAALLASSADEPLDMNYVRQHTLDYQISNDCEFETAALRVFSNADGAYGANVNLLIDSGAWTDESELAATYANRKCYAFGVDGSATRQSRLLETALADVDLAYQNLESVELGVTQLDYYFDTLGGINAMVKKSRGTAVPTYIGDQTRGDGTVRTLQEQVALETRTRMLNPKWYEGQLKHGYEGVRTIETSITNTLGWSATTGQVSPWVYTQMARTFVLDPRMRERLAALNPTASARMANRLIEASERNYWSPNEEELQALHAAGDELEDRLEGITAGAAA